MLKKHVMDNLFLFIFFLKGGMYLKVSRSSLFLQLPWELLREFLDSTLKKGMKFEIISSTLHFDEIFKQSLNSFVNNEENKCSKNRENVRDDLFLLIFLLCTSLRTASVICRFDTEHRSNFFFNITSLIHLHHLEISSVASYW